MMRWANEIVKATRSIAQAIIYIGALAFVFLLLDRAPPFAVVSVEPASARPGEWVHIKARVRRDADRDCSAEISRYIYDADGSRFELGTSIASPELIRQLERTVPGELRFSMLLPAAIPPGDAAIVSVLNYVCHKPQVLWPIQVTTSIPFTVLPPL